MARVNEINTGHALTIGVLLVTAGVQWGVYSASLTRIETRMDVSDRRLEVRLDATDKTLAAVHDNQISLNMRLRAIEQKLRMADIEPR